MKTALSILALLIALTISNFASAQVVQTFAGAATPISYDGTWSESMLTTGGVSVAFFLGEEDRWILRGNLGGGALVQPGEKPTVPIVQTFGLGGYKLTKEYLVLGGGGVNIGFPPEGETAVTPLLVGAFGWAPHKRVLLAGLVALTKDGFAPGVQLTINLF